jgi:nucleotide-binding universal stress UspA family protein
MTAIAELKAAEFNLSENETLEVKPSEQKPAELRPAQKEPVEPKAQLPGPALKRVLLATDLSDASAHALWYATRIAQEHHSTLWLLHVLPAEARSFIPMDSLPHDMDRKRLIAERKMQEIAATLAAHDVPHHIVLEPGAVRDIVLSQIKRNDIDLLVMGTHGRGGINKLAMGSVAEELLRLAPCPVLTVGPHVPPPASSFRSILFATDFGPASCRAVPLVLFLAAKHNAKLFLLNLVVNMPLPSSATAAYAPAGYAAEEVADWISSARKSSGRKLRELVPPNTGLLQEPVYLVSADFTEEGILEAARKYKPDLIVMGANHAASARLAAHMPWATTHAVLCSAPCPVLTIAE